MTSIDESGYFYWATDAGDVSLAGRPANGITFRTRRRTDGISVEVETGVTDQDIDDLYIALGELIRERDAQLRRTLNTRAAMVRDAYSGKPAPDTLAEV